MNRKFNVAIAGATGLVGRTMVKVLEERNFPMNNLKLLASERSVGKSIRYKDSEIHIEELTEHSFDGMDIALFSAGGSTSLTYAKISAAKGCVVIDNSSAWRMHVDVPLVVPEVNSDDILNHRGIIANPNCSTIQLMVALKPIQDKFGLKRIIVSTYQSISGAGQKGVDKLNNEIAGQQTDDKHKIAYSTMFHEYSKIEAGMTVEEKKMIDESRKILHLPELKMSVTCVRVPTLGGHGESVNIETNNDFTIEEIWDILEKQENVRIIDDLLNDEYPTPTTSNNTDYVYIGRIRRDTTIESGLNLWVVSDNLRKGAATNAVQIAEHLIQIDKFDYKPIG